VKVREAHAFYCGEVTMVDSWFGRFVRCLEDMDLMNKTAIIFTSDHGTYHGEHGGLFGKHPRRVLSDGTIAQGQTPFHGYSPLYEEVVATPLLIYVPNMPPGVYSGLTSAIDIAPTVLDILGQEIPADMEGRSLLPAAKDSSVPGREYVVSGQPLRNKATSIIWVDGQVHSMENDSSETVTTDEWSLIYAVEPGMSELFHLSSDPKQEKNVINEHPEVARELHQLLVKSMRDHNVSSEFLNPRSELKL